MTHAPILDPPWATQPFGVTRPTVQGHRGRDDEPTLEIELTVGEGNSGQACPDAPRGSGG
jgi:hypothetical protein